MSHRKTFPLSLAPYDGPAGLRPRKLPSCLRDAHDVVFALPTLVLRSVAPASYAVIAAAEDTAPFSGRARALRYKDCGLVLADVADTEMLDVFTHARELLAYGM